MDKFLLIEVTTAGTPVYESETGPDIGRDNISTYLAVIHEDALDAYAPGEEIASCKVLAELDERGVRALQRSAAHAMKVHSIAA
jgi:hypothetical protein